MARASRQEVVTVTESRGTLTTSTPATPSHPTIEGLPGPAPRRARTIVGGFFLTMGGVHIGLVSADPQIYGPFANGALIPWFGTLWDEVFMANPAAWGLAVAAFEIACGTLLLIGGAPARVGWVGVIGFHVVLMGFGWGFWAWSVPVLLILVPAAVMDWHRLSPSGVRPTAATT
jgi:hypothetical protein